MNPEPNGYDSLVVGGILIYAFPISHYSSYAPHLVYIINLNRILICFGGDNLPDSIEFSNYSFNEMEIDIACMRFGDLFKIERINTVNQLINPKLLIPMHYLYGNNFINIVEVEDSINKFQNIIPETFIYKDYLESKRFKFQPINSISINLNQNYPNPFNPTTKIEFTIPINSHVTLVIYDIL